MTLRIEVQDGQVIKNTDIGGTMEMYVMICEQSQGETHIYSTKVVQGKSKTKFDDNIITWNQSIKIPISCKTQNTQLLFKIVDKDITSDDLVAEGCVQPQKCGMFNPQINKYRLNLNLPKEEGKQIQPAGYLIFTTSFTE